MYSNHLSFRRIINYKNYWNKCYYVQNDQFKMTYLRPPPKCQPFLSLERLCWCNSADGCERFRAFCSCWKVLPRRMACRTSHCWSRIPFFAPWCSSRVRSAANWAWVQILSKQGAKREGESRRSTIKSF